MKTIEDVFEIIKQECEKHILKTGNDVNLIDVIFGYGNPGYILNDWDEGKNNDQFWDEKRGCHSADSFIQDMIELIKTFMKK